MLPAAVAAHAAAHPCPLGQATKAGRRAARPAGGRARALLRGAPCFASLTYLTLAGHSFALFPPGILAATRLAQLDLSHCCFEQLPEGVSALIALPELRLGRHAASKREIRSCLDAQALGSLAGLPQLRGLVFIKCSVQFCAEFQAAAVQPRLERLQLDASHPALARRVGQSWAL